MTGAHSKRFSKTQLDGPRALHRLGEIVRAADVKGQEHVTPEGLGLRAIAEGFAALGLPDEERLRLEFPLYDALYAYAQGRIAEHQAT